MHIDEHFMFIKWLYACEILKNLVKNIANIALWEIISGDVI